MSYLERSWWYDYYLDLVQFMNDRANNLFFQKEKMGHRLTMSLQ